MSDRHVQLHQGRREGVYRYDEKKPTLTQQRVMRASPARLPQSKALRVVHCRTYYGVPYSRQICSARPPQVFRDQDPAETALIRCERDRKRPVNAAKAASRRQIRQRPEFAALVREIGSALSTRRRPAVNLVRPVSVDTTRASM